LPEFTRGGFRFSVRWQTILDCNERLVDFLATHCEAEGDGLVRPSEHHLGAFIIWNKRRWHACSKVKVREPRQKSTAPLGE
jgi:hypothetical protein